MDARHETNVKSIKRKWPEWKRRFWKKQQLIHDQNPELPLISADTCDFIQRDPENIQL